MAYIYLLVVYLICNFFAYDFDALMFYLSYLFLACIIITSLYLFIIHDGCEWHFPLPSSLVFLVMHFSCVFFYVPIKIIIYLLWLFKCWYLYINNLTCDHKAAFNINNNITPIPLQGKLSILLLWSRKYTLCLEVHDSVKHKASGVLQSSVKNICNKSYLDVRLLQLRCINIKLPEARRDCGSVLYSSVLLDT